MGKIVLITANLKNNQIGEFILKEIVLPFHCVSAGDTRKKLSYFVEVHFYQNGFAKSFQGSLSRMPTPYYVRVRSDNKMQICMSKINGQALPIGENEAKQVLIWLAYFLSSFWGNVEEAVAKGLISQGTFWYLDTRLDELENISNRGIEGRLKQASFAIDWYLKNDLELISICQGDCKGANILFDYNTKESWLVDFQYTGACSISKDLAYFFTCACEEENADEIYLDYYLEALNGFLVGKSRPITKGHLEVSL